ncbi:MAG TPA: hypothetical protein VN709_08310 [Terriglobales bacterium]|nr:hypothetical protein [Terriglobales bacterium]
MTSNEASQNLADGLVHSFDTTRKSLNGNSPHRRFLAMKQSELSRGVKEYETQENLDTVIRGYQIAEKRLFGKIELLPGETDLTKILGQTGSR